ncbi:hypothetical protein [Streptomyces sp. NPDC006335]|uniref:hypothetical protein n=1 Tax=Streptomyces sp. NPDC006335 TaxID=3156895 RepID=UPI0033BAA9F4
MREAWAELLPNRSGLLSRQQVRALRAATELQPRMHRDHLDVPVFVADRTTLTTLQSPVWHPALEEALRRHLRRPFHLDVLLVHDYHKPRTGIRHRRLAKDAGLIDGPLEPEPYEESPDLAMPAPLAEGSFGRVAITAHENTADPDPDVTAPWKPTTNSGA